MKGIMKELGTSFIFTAVLAVLLCGVYPLIVWLSAQLLFPEKARGSLMMENGRYVGSRLIAQGFTGEHYFHPRPSAAGQGFDGTRSGGSNLGPTSQKLIDVVKERATEYRKENSLPAHTPLPADAVTASASGLDPHISVGNARLQMQRVARARRLDERTLAKKIEEYTEDRDLWIFGEKRLNVLLLNVALDKER